MSTKWWEQKWRTSVNDGETSCAVYEHGGRMVADLRIHREVEEETSRAKFIACGPAITRALLAFLPENGHTMECGNVSENDYWCSQECRDARTALKSAGVL